MITEIFLQRFPVLPNIPPGAQHHQVHTRCHHQVPPAPLGVPALLALQGGSVFSWNLLADIREGVNPTCPRGGRPWWGPGNRGIPRGQLLGAAAMLRRRLVR